MSWLTEVTIENLEEKSRRICYNFWLSFDFLFLFAANSLIRSWWYREAYIKPWQPNSPDTSQSGKIFLFICLVIQTVYTSFQTSKYNVAVRGIYLNVIIFFFCLQPTVSSEVGGTEKHTSSHGSQTPLTPHRVVGFSFLFI